MENKDFWTALEKLVNSSRIVIDRPKGSRHPKYPSIVYSVDYGYLEETSSLDGDEIDVWKGSDKTGIIDAIIYTVDLVKRDSEIKVLIGCTEEEKEKIYAFHNETDAMKGILIRR